MSDPASPVKCARHGETPSTFLCRHLVDGVACGFHASEEDPTDRWPDAWCDACQALLDREGEFSDEHDIALVCTDCYELLRARSQRIPAPVGPGQLSVTPEQFSELARQSFERSQERQARAKRRWGFGDKKQWFFDDESMTLRFYDTPKGESVIADVTIVGSYSKLSNSWMWVWGNDQYADEERAKVDPVRVFGEVRGIEKLANARWEGEEVDAWEVTQIASDLLGAAAIYRAPFDHMLVFMLLDGFRIVHPS